MPNAIASITRAATRREGEPLNILTCPTHERFEVGICKTGHRSRGAVRLLRRRGYDARNLAGGMDAWRRAGLDEEGKG